MQRHRSKKVIAATEEVFNRYKLDENLKEFDIFHMYGDGRPCMLHGNGYIDAQNFQLWGYNTKIMKKRDLSTHDSINFTGCEVRNVRIFMDGSTMVKFWHLVMIEGEWISQAQEFKRVTQ